MARATIGKRGKLTDKQRVFVEEYLKDYNGQRAYRAAGYSAKCAGGQAYKILDTPHVRAYLQQKAREKSKRLELNADRLMLENMRVGFANVLDLFNDDGSLKPISEWGPDLGAAVKAVEVTTSDDGVSVSKVAFWDKNTALERLMKHLGLYEADNMQKHAQKAIEDLPDDMRRLIMEKLRGIRSERPELDRLPDSGSGDSITH